MINLLKIKDPVLGFMASLILLFLMAVLLAALLEGQRAHEIKKLCITSSASLSETQAELCRSLF